MTEDQVDSNYIACELLKNNINILYDDYSLEKGFVVCSKVINSINVQLRCELTEYFPYEFPKIYILDSCRSNIKGIPHINSDKSICLFDDETNIPDFRAPNDLVVTSIEKAFSIISDGLNGKNLSDFKINVPIIMLWVEPYALCGHALILNKPQDIYSEFFNVNLEFKDCVILNASELYKRESGCQSTYVPYSGLDIKIFVNSFVQRLVSKRFDVNKNYHYIWFGNLSKCKEFNAVTDERWKDFDNGSEYIERIG